MRQTTKSNLINYSKLYNLLILYIVLSFIYIEIKLFLPYSHFISFLCLLLGIFNIILYFFTKRRLELIISLIITLISIGLSITYVYI